MPVRQPVLHTIKHNQTVQQNLEMTIKIKRTGGGEGDKMQKKKSQKRKPNGGS